MMLAFLADYIIFIYVNVNIFASVLLPRSSASILSKNKALDATLYHCTVLNIFGVAT